MFLTNEVFRLDALPKVRAPDSFLIYSFLFCHFLSEDKYATLGGRVEGAEEGGGGQVQGGAK